MTETKKNILFVDDEKQVLDGLRILLRRQRRQWNMVFALGGEAALEKLASRPFDVLVTDMRMDGIDGLTLLKRAQSEYPSTVRIVLSGYTEMEVAVRSASVAHQFLTKPCSRKQIMSVVERSCAIQELINNPAVKRVVGGIDALPKLPRIYLLLLDTLSKPNVSAKGVARVLQQDLAMCAKLLQLVNSSFFRLGKRITSIEHAIAFLGFNQIRSLVLGVEVFQSRMDTVQLVGFPIDSLLQHVMLVANLARAITPDKRRAEDAFIAGMFHDVGKMILAMGIPGYVRDMMRKARYENSSLHELEREAMGTTHAEVGAYLLGLWGLPFTVVDAVAHHHEPQAATGKESDIASTIYIADHLAHEAEAARSDSDNKFAGNLNLRYLKDLGVLKNLESWRCLALDLSDQTKIAMAR